MLFAQNIACDLSFRLSRADSVIISDLNHTEHASKLGEEGEEL